MKLKKILNLTLAACLILMLAVPTFAAPGNTSAGEKFMHDHMDLEKAQEEVEGGALGGPVQKFSNYALYAYAFIIIAYMGLLAKWFFLDGGEGKSKAFIGAILFVAFIALQWSLTIEAINMVSGS
jgi:hypothetical protein